MNRTTDFKVRRSSLQHPSMQNLYLCLWVSAIALSACFPAIEVQLLVSSVIVGAKWIAEGKTQKINIILGGKE
ncbi:MAG: hypothetical protein PHS46_06805 [Candidatus Omnitrophica bacterium]|nr:hypothetical protein [Candidatus Omnitrophota bacterium]